MANVSLDALISILSIILLVTIFYFALSNVLDSVIGLVQRDSLTIKAASTSLLVSVYSYSLNNGYFNPEIECSVGSKKITCISNNTQVMIDTYRRRGGGN